MTITGKHDVYEFLVDGQSGLIPGDVSGKVIMVGVCSKGDVGKAYRLGDKSPVRDILGSGPLADAVEDAFAGAAATGGQNTVLIAVPAAGTPGGYISAVTRQGKGPDATATGYPAANADIVVRITADGLPGIALCTTSTDNGKTWNTAKELPLTGHLSLPGVGVTLSFDPEKEVLAGTAYRITVRVPIGPVAQVGPGPAVTPDGAVLTGAQVELLITRTGKVNDGQYQLSLDGGDTYDSIRTLPLDGVIKAGDTGVAITLDSTAAYEAGTLYRFALLPPVPTIMTIMEALEQPLARLDPEFVHVVGPTDAVDWAAFAMLAAEQWQRHRPMPVTCEARLPYEGESLDAWADWLRDERAKGAAPFVACNAAFGEILGRDNTRKVRNAGGLLVGKIIGIPVMRHIGRTKNGPVTPLTLPNGWDDIQADVRDAGFITAQYYEGLNGTYWGDDKMLAEPTSTYQFLVVVRVVCKALRLMRIQALMSMFDEAGDPLHDEGAAGLAYLKTNLEAACDVMTTARPRELAAAIVDIPSGQDIVNNGVDADVDLVGIPIIKRIRINTKYVYAGGRFDPRITTQAE